MIDANRLRQMDTDHNTKILGLMKPGQTYKTWCYAAQKYATVFCMVEGFSVRIGRKAETLPLAAAVESIVAAHHG